MNIHITPLYTKVRRRIPYHLKAIVVLITLIAPVHSLCNQNVEPHEQEFLITAYYSPLPGQCCYVTGGLEADKQMNGEGIRSADGTGVYPGMLAAPSSYPFGTVVSLPGIGTLTVHDRGGAITERADGMHRLDIWVGHGEEGLARALDVGVIHLKGTVYPPGSDQPPELFALEDLPAPLSKLEYFNIERDNLLALRPKAGDRGLSVATVQEYLKELGYFQHAITGLFGTVTQNALAAFIDDYYIGTSADHLNEKSAAILMAAKRRKEARQPIGAHVDAKASKATVAEAQRLLRFLGYYHGRTHGEYDDNLASAILRFQQDYGLVGTAGDPGAGRIGPITLATITNAWNRELVYERARMLLDLAKVDSVVSQRGVTITRYLREGDNGAQVRLLQQKLAEKGLFPAEEINGNFGPLTQQAVMQYQLDRGLIGTQKESGAGYVGPATLSSLRHEERVRAYNIVRGEGWNAL